MRIPDTFRAATWNMGGGEARGGPTDDDTLDLLTKLREADCSILLGQEVQERDNRAMLRDLGYHLHRTRPESVVAWLPDLWVPVAEHDVVLNPEHPYFRKGGNTPVHQKAARVILCDRAGRSVDVLSYHLPSSVQQPNPPGRRIAALHECMETLADIGDRTDARAVLFGGDDNVDEAGPFGPWRFMLEAETGLRQVRAPNNTLGRRKVDDFRVRGLRVIGDGRTLHGPTHHNAHVRKFGWRRSR